MDQQQYRIIKMQLNREKEKVLAEISALTREKQAVEQRKRYEIHVFRSRTGTANHTIQAGMLSTAAFSPERLKQLDKQLGKITEFIGRNERELEQMKEKERTIDELYRQHEKRRLQELSKQEEKDLLDLKMTIGASSQ